MTHGWMFTLGQTDLSGPLGSTGLPELRWSQHQHTCHSGGSRPTETGRNGHRFLFTTRQESPSVEASFICDATAHLQQHHAGRMDESDASEDLHSVLLGSVQLFYITWNTVGWKAYLVTKETFAFRRHARSSYRWGSSDGRRATNKAQWRGLPASVSLCS